MKSVSGPKFILPAIDGSTVKQKLFLVALLVLAVAWPFMVSRGTVDIATLTMIYIILGLGLNVVVGLSGLLVLGYGGFYAIGAYTFALLNHYYGLGFWTCLPIAGLMAAAAGFLLGFPVLRLRGDYLAIVTLGFGEIVRILLLNNTEVTGGPNGISQIPKPTFFGLEFSRTAREGGWDTFSNFFNVKYDPSDRVIFLYLVALLLVVFSNFAVASSFLGVTLGLFDYLADLFGFDDSAMGRFKTALLTFLPPIVGGLLWPNGFLYAIGYAGLAATIWAAIVPALLARKSRKRFGSPKFRVWGGKPMIALILVFGIGNAVVHVLSSFNLLPVYQ